MAADNRLKLIQQADKLFKQGKTEASLKEYQKILDIKPDDIEIRKIIGDLKLKLNKIDEAVRQFEWIADYYLKEGFYPKATAMFKRITRIDPQNEGISFKLADLYAKQGLVIESKQIYLELVEEYKRQNNHKKALGIYKKILEFDRGNTKMHLLLAENYLRENMVEEAINEYLFTTEMLIKKKEYKPAEEILQEVFKKVKNIRILEKLVTCFLGEGDEQQAIQALSSLGDEIYKHPDLLKILGELFLKKNQIDRAEKVYKKLIEYDTSQTEMIMNLGKVYIQREEYDKVYQLFLPLVERFVSEKKFDEATSLLRFIITSNNTYLPALLKLAAIFKLTGKTSSLIAIDESLIPIYEKQEMTAELKEVLGELIKLSDSPFNYQEMLEKLSEGKAVREDPGQKEREFITFQLNNVNQAIREKNFKRAAEILQTAKGAFPKNVDIRVKLFDLLQMTENVDALVNEGIELLEIYKDQNNEGQYNSLYEKLSRLRPNDERLLFLSGNEKTNIEIDFDHSELIEQISELHYSGMPEVPRKEEREEDVFLLEGEDSLTFKQTQSEQEFTKGLSSHLVELDFYISEGYFDNAQKILEKLRKEYPESKEVISRLERVKSVKAQKPATKAKAPVESPLGEIVVEESIHDIAEESGMLQQFEDSKVGIDMFPLKADEPQELFSDQPTGKHPKIEDMENIFIEQPQASPQRMTETPKAESAKPAAVTDQQADDFDNIFSEQPRETHEKPEAMDVLFDEQPTGIQRVPDDLAKLLAEQPKGAHQEIVDEENIFAPPREEPVQESGSGEEIQFQIDMERVEPEQPVEVLPLSEAEQEQIIQSPSANPSGKKKAEGESMGSSSVDLLNLDNILMEEKPAPVESPFREIEDLVLEAEDELLQEEAPFLEEERFFEVERWVKDELEAIAFWVKELEKQRTSTMEKNMMEIFKEFKRGVDEKIGHEDFETRYNLGIAYKEMGLLEEAIHEFLISAKQPAKFFDSAGMLGICFREKGMLDESIGWFEKALKAPERNDDELKAIKFELFLTAKQKEDYLYARKLAEEIMRKDPEYRNIREYFSQMPSK